jgi:hypothetical protein
MTPPKNPSYVKAAEQTPNGAPPKTDPFSKASSKRVLLPCTGRNERAFAKEVGTIIGPLNVAFLHNDRIAEIHDEPPPVETENTLDRNKLARGGLKFRTLTGVRTKGWIEQFLTTGTMIKELDTGGNPIRNASGGVRWKFAEKTMGEELARSLLENPFFQRQLPRIQRILPVPIPMLLPNGDIRVPQPGYNKDLEIYCALNAPPIELLDIEEALEILRQAHQGFEFTSDQSRTHAYARFLSPFFRGITGYAEPVPAWHYNANRPRCGKDYLAGITQITYEGFAFEDAALSDDPDETCKRITAGLMAGRRFFHFANCQGHLSDKYFIQAITDMVWRARLLGSNDAASDLQISNEAEYSFSANQGLTAREDVEPRLRKIELAFFAEDANSRIFPVEDLHGWARANRKRLLSAAYTIYHYWTKKGMPEGNPFSSYKRWGRVIGGVMNLLKLGDPTLPHESQLLFSGDLRTDAMKALFILAYEHYPETWFEKKDLYQLVADNQDDNERLDWFGELSGERKKAAQTKLGKTLSQFQNRILAEIKLQIDASLIETQRWKVRFTKNP